MRLNFESIRYKAIHAGVEFWIQRFDGVDPDGPVFDLSCWDERGLAADDAPEDWRHSTIGRNYRSLYEAECAADEALPGIFASDPPTAPVTERQIETTCEEPASCA